MSIQNDAYPFDLDGDDDIAHNIPADPDDFDPREEVGDDRMGRLSAADSRLLPGARKQLFKYAGHHARTGKEPGMKRPPRTDRKRLKQDRRSRD